MGHQSQHEKLNVILAGNLFLFEQYILVLSNIKNVVLTAFLILGHGGHWLLWISFLVPSDDSSDGFNLIVHPVIQVNDQTN